MWQEILSIYKNRGDEKYMIGEPITQIQHAIQTCQYIKKTGGCESLQVAGLLHDIGHLVQTYNNPEDGVDDKHEIIGSQWLKDRGFGPGVYEPIKNHVDSKKYLCAKIDSYIDTLTDASRCTLLLQGGIMSETQMKIFENERYFKESLILREADDSGKNINITELPEFDSFGHLVCRVLQRYKIMCKLTMLSPHKTEWKKLDKIISEIENNKYTENEAVIKNAKMFSGIYQIKNNKRKDEIEIYNNVISRLTDALSKN